MVTLRRVLEAFEETQGTIRLDHLSRRLEIDPGTLDSMIQHWVQKGRIREVLSGPPTGTRCGPCGVKSECPVASYQPAKRYTLARETPVQDECIASCSHERWTSPRLSKYG